LTKSSTENSLSLSGSALGRVELLNSAETVLGLGFDRKVEVKPPLEVALPNPRSTGLPGKMLKLIFVDGPGVPSS
jgi:hypothetical protein